MVARRRRGAPALLRAGGLLAGLGMATALLAPALPLSVVGFALFGVGLANMVPVLFGAAGRTRNVPRAAASPRSQRPAMAACSPGRR